MSEKGRNGYVEKAKVREALKKLQKKIEKGFYFWREEDKKMFDEFREELELG